MRSTLLTQAIGVSALVSMPLPRARFRLINSLITDFISLFVGFNSLFGRVGNLLGVCTIINHLRADVQSHRDLEPALSQYFPLYEGNTRDD